VSGSPQTSQSVCGPGELGESLEKHTAGRLLNLKGKTTQGRGEDSTGSLENVKNDCAITVQRELWPYRENVTFCKHNSRLPLPFSKQSMV